MPSTQRNPLKLVVGLIAAGSMVAVLAGCGDDSSEVPTSAEAATVLTNIYEARNDGLALCEFASTLGNCKTLLADAGEAPEATPEILCDMEYEGSETRYPGRILRVATENNSGEKVQSDIMSIKVDGKVSFMNPVYWVASSVSDSDSTDNPIVLDCGAAS